MQRTACCGRSFRRRRVASREVHRCALESQVMDLLPMNWADLGHCHMLRTVLVGAAHIKHVSSFGGSSACWPQRFMMLKLTLAMLNRAS